MSLLRLIPALALCAFSADAPPLLRDAAWTQPSAALARDLTHAPGECLARGGDDVELGRALFRTPALLGGPVARIGISCQSCHANGRVNARFLLPELTDRPGRADVTSEWASAVRGDGVMNPRPIPDLVDANARDAFGAAREPLEAFVRGVIVDEFQGAPPPDAAFAALIAYVRALEGRACPQQDERLTLAHAAADVRRARAAASAYAHDRATAALAILAAQDALGRIAERLPGEAFARDRRMLARLAGDLAAARDAPDLAHALADPAWTARFDALVRKLERRERETYFNEETLAAALAP